MGNPLVSRQPKPLDAYRKEGVRFVVTNSYGLIESATERKESFPSFTRFYDSLEESRLVKRFDPAKWAGKGPVIWIYDISAESQEDEGSSAGAHRPP